MVIDLVSLKDKYNLHINGVIHIGAHFGQEYDVLTSLTKVLPNTVVSFEWAEEQKEKIILTLEHIRSLGYKKFSYTESDGVLFDEDINWVPFEKLNLLENLDPARKRKWGMIYFKL
jgi:hypothetical protein